MVSSSRTRAALEACETLLSPGRLKWHLSPYLQAALDVAQDPDRVYHIPVYQSVALDLLLAGQLPVELSILDVGSPAGIGALAVLDVLLTWHTACALYELSPGIERVRVQVTEAKTREAKRVWRAWRTIVEQRSVAVPDLKVLSDCSAWTEDVLTRPASMPNLILWPLPWRQPAAVTQLLDRAPAGTILVGLNWESSGDEANIYQWRYDLIRDRQDLVPLGPCGQEYGRDLPPACRECTHGRRAAIRLPGATDDTITPAWNYAMAVKGAGRCENLSWDLISAETLGQTVTGPVHLRYTGTFREQEATTDHPDSAGDDPRDTKWQQYLKVCPGHSGATRIAIERRSGMQTPRLRYGQWLEVHDLQPQQPYSGYPDVYVMRARDEAAFHAIDALPLAETSVEQYTPQVRAAVDEAAYRLFGFGHMRGFQHTILDRVLCGQDIFAIAATGGGKSECYILPAMLLPGITVVISPLKSLILDQYEQRIRDRFGLDYLTTFIDGDVPFYERQGRLRRLMLGHSRLVYMTPEQLERDYVLDALRQANERVGLRYLAMDEAHCISQWGHDFRPSYLNIVQRLQDYGLTPTRIALTATASPLVRDDVCDELRLDRRPLSDGGDVFIDSSNRPELNLIVRRVARTEEKAEIIVDALRKLGDRGSAIVFMPHTGGPPDHPRDLGAPISAPRPENAGMVSPGVTPFAHYLAGKLEQPVAIYHGALDDEASPGSPSEDDVDGETAEGVSQITRQQEQRAFMADQKRVMVATKGFGMGVDKPDIRLVIHRSPPANLEAYLQEAGRAGRDEQLATVILLFSEDRPTIANVLPDAYLARASLPSDFEIQEYFVEQRYVRREDVAAMIAFLRSDLPRRISGALYFTSDQAVQFLDRSASGGGYTWPFFPPRRKGKTYESDDHKQILDRGHLYKQKRAHVSRILAVLFNNRPTIDDQVLPLVRSVHQTGTLVRNLRVYNPQRIVDSVAYFGRRLRRVGVDASSLHHLLPDGDRTDLTALAARLGLSLRETASMLRDIRYCEGRTDRRGFWVGTLLNFWWIEAPRWVAIPDPYTNLAAWRAYAGAYTRTHSHRGGRTLDDYFPWGVLNRPQGWEVAPGPGLELTGGTRYLDAFMTLHDERQRNDRNNFSYLLERYVGGEEGPSECLRSLLLGYLKTQEVVVGGKCYGCSVCVPDLRFDRHPLEQRKQAIVRLMPETIAAMEGIEASNRSRTAQSRLDQLLAHVAREDEQGRSGTTYLDSWLARLIQDDPEHQGALRTRLRAYEQGVLELAPQDLLAAVERLIRLTDVPEDLAWIDQVIEGCQDDAPHAGAWLALIAQRAEIARRQEAWAREAELWGQVLERSDRERQAASIVALQRRALRRLCWLYGRDGPLFDEARAMQAALRLARLPGCTLEEAREAYRAAVPHWKWRDVESELSAVQGAAQPAVLLVYLEAAPAADHRMTLRWLERHLSALPRWPSSAYPLLDEWLGSGLDAAPRVLAALAEVLIEGQAEAAAPARYLLRAWSAGARLQPTQLQYLAGHLESLNPEWCRGHLDARDDAKELVLALVESLPDRSVPLAWLRHLPERLMNELPGDQVVEMLAAAVAREALPDAKTLCAVVKSIGPSFVQELGQRLVSLGGRHPAPVLDLIEACLSDEEPDPALVRVLFPILLQSPLNTRSLVKTLDALSRNRELVQGEDLVALCLDNWVALVRDASSWPALRAHRIEGHALVSTTMKWIAQAGKAHRVDMMIAILRDVRKRSPHTWLTPVSLEFQALCAAGRFAEAETILKHYPDIQIKGQDAQRLLVAARAARKERTTAHEWAYEQLWKVAS